MSEHRLQYRDNKQELVLSGFFVVVVLFLVVFWGSRELL